MLTLAVVVSLHAVVVVPILWRCHLSLISLDRLTVVWGGW